MSKVMTYIICVSLVVTSVFFGIYLKKVTRVKMANNEQNSVWVDSTSSTEDVKETKPIVVEPKITTQLIASSQDEAIALAKKHDKKILYMFTANWCPPCRQMKTGTLKNKDVIEKMKDYVFYMCDIDVDAKTPQAYGISALPTLLIANKDGVGIKKSPGLHSPKQMLEFLKD